MLADLGVQWAIVGHSEHRKICKHTDFDIGSKVKHAIDNKMNVILCVGDSIVERMGGKTNLVTTGMLESVAKWIKPDEWRHIVICYEPVWAMGDLDTKVDPVEVQNACVNMRDWVRNVVHKDIG